MRLPQVRDETWPRLDFFKANSLTFKKPDHAKYPSMNLAYAAGRAGGTMTGVLSAANEQVGPARPPPADPGAPPAPPRPKLLPLPRRGDAAWPPRAGRRAAPARPTATSPRPLPVHPSPPPGGPDVH